MALAGNPQVTMIVGSGRDLIRATPLYRALRARGQVGLSLVLTGHERDADLASWYFRGLAPPQPDGLLEPGGGTRTERTARILAACETFLRHRPTDLVVLQGASDAILSCAVVCKQQGLAVAHLEAGLRSPGRATDSAVCEVVDDLSDCWSAPWPQAAAALAEEGHPPERILDCGNLMVDTLAAYREAAEAVSWEGLEQGEEYGVMAIGGSPILDNPINLRKMAQAAEALAEDVRLVCPLGPDARRRLEMWNLKEALEGAGDILLPDAKGFLDTFGLVGRALFVITDSGDLQDQASFLDVPCVTVAESTDRLITLERGTNVVVGRDAAALVGECEAVLEGRRRRSDLPAEWDGQAAGRIAHALEDAARRAAEKRRGTR